MMETCKFILKLVLLTYCGIFGLNNICCAISNQTSIAVTQSNHDKLTELTAFVNSGLEYIKKNGQAKAYQEFSNPKGKFSKGDLFLFVYNNQGVNLAHGAEPQNYVGKNMLHYRDQYGTPVVRLLIKVAKLGGGYLHYYWAEPSTNEIKIKTAYVKPIDSNSFIGSGLYENIEVPVATQIHIEELKAFVNEAIAYYRQNGEKKAFKEFNNPDGKFRRGKMIIFVGNFKGVCVASSDPSIVGRDDFNTTDDFGTPFVQMFIEAAKNGGGVVTYYWTNFVTKKSEPKTAYVTKLSDQYLIGAGNY